MNPHALLRQLRDHIAANVPADQVEAVLRAYIDIDALPPVDLDTPETPPPYAQIAPDTDGPSWAETLAAATCSNLPIAQLPREHLPNLRGIPHGEASSSAMDPTSPLQDPPSPQSGEGPGVRSEARTSVSAGLQADDGSQADLVTSPADPSSPLQDPPSPLCGEGPGVRDVSQRIQSIPEKRFCTGTTRAGQPCRAYALRERDLCLFHEDPYYSGLAAMQENGRETRRRRKEAVLGLDEFDVDLSDALGIQMALELFLRMDLVGAISSERSARMIRYLRAIQLNVPRLIEDGATCPDIYLDHRRRTLRAALTISDRSSAADGNRRTERLDDLAASRRQVLRVNKEFGVNQPRNYSPSHPSSPYKLPRLPKHIAALLGP